MRRPWLPRRWLHRQQATVEPDSVTEGTVTVGGQGIDYKAVAGTLTVGATDAEDATLGFDGKLLPDSGVKPPANPAEAPATARMFYAAYFKKGSVPESRPITFIYNGGPGSATMWLHLGSFGPRRVVVPDTEHQEAAPYALVNNQYSLLDVSNIVFIDAPGTGLSRTFGKDRAKAFYGVDGDGHAFERFIRRFLTKYGRWNSPKYLFGESYGTPRSAVLAADLRGVDLNGIILLSQILSFDNSVDDPKWNPGVDQSYAIIQRAGQRGLKAECRVGGTYRPLAPELEEEILRIAGEAVTNVLRHADAKTVSVDLQYSPHRLFLRVEDDGRGFDVAAVSSIDGHFGLKGMRERTATIAGQLKIESLTGQGTSVTMEVNI